MIKGTIKKVLISLLAATLVMCAAPSVARAATSAELQSELDAANSKLDEINQELEAANERLNETQYELDQTSAQISTTQQAISDAQDQINAKQAELDEAQRVLAGRVSSTYKAGSNTFLSILLDSASFEDFVSNVYYADKVSESDAAAIESVKTLQSELQAQKSALDAQESQLESQQAQQQSLVDQQSSQKADFESQQASQSSYVSSLDQEVKDKLSEEEAAREAAAAAARQTATASSGSDDSGYTPGSGSSSGGSLTQSQRSAIVAAAYSQLGTPYVWGGENPGSGLDCSGLTQYCYAAAGLSIPHSAAAQCSLSSLWSVSSAQPGDLVFYTNGSYVSHVAVYIGNGQIIQEPYAGSYCQVSSVNMGLSIVGCGIPS